MSKPNYILVPIDEFNERLTDIKCGASSDHYMTEFIQLCPKVDLSETGIRTKADAYIAEDDENNEMTDSTYVYSRAGARWFYEQCAKDLLNTK